VVAVVGPTAVGKSSFALDVAFRFGGEVISCDSMQVYRGLDIGTDKLPATQRRGVPHHLLDVAEPGATFSAGAFRRKALEVLADFGRRGCIGVLVGGTGLYYRALVCGLVEAPSRDEALRARLFEKVRIKGPERLHRVLSRLDPLHAPTVRSNDALRIVRALEVRILSGVPLGEKIRDNPLGSGPLLRVLKIGLTAPRRLLYDSIESRVEAMVAAGWLDEVAHLRERGVLVGPVAKAIGYGELASVLDGALTLEGAVDRIKIRSRNLAKRQWTWFRKEADVAWYDVTQEAWHDRAFRCIETWIQATPRQP
jgi:tRNA dimethylallyltransferase